MNERLAIQIELGAAAAGVGWSSLPPAGSRCACESQKPSSKRTPVINVSFTPPEHHTNK